MGRSVIYSFNILISKEKAIQGYTKSNGNNYSKHNKNLLLFHKTSLYDDLIIYIHYTNFKKAKSIKKGKKLISANIKYLMDLGVKNYREIFLEYYDLFLLDSSNFMGIFNKYDRDDLVDKLEKNIAIIEYL